jgi:hypothetical protein
MHFRFAESAKNKRERCEIYALKQLQLVTFQSNNMLTQLLHQGTRDNPILGDSQPMD